MQQGPDDRHLGRITPEKCVQPQRDIVYRKGRGDRRDYFLIPGLNGLGPVLVADTEKAAAIPNTGARARNLDVQAVEPPCLGVERLVVRNVSNKLITLIIQDPLYTVGEVIVVDDGKTAGLSGEIDEAVLRVAKFPASVGHRLIHLRHRPAGRVIGSG